MLKNYLAVSSSKCWLYSEQQRKTGYRGKSRWNWACQKHLTVGENITLGCSLGACSPEQVGFPARKPELLPGRLLLWENSEVGARQRLAALHRLCSCLSKMLQSNARKSSACLFSSFFLHWRWSKESLYCNQLNFAGEASGFALNRMRLASRDDDKPVDLLEGCKNNCDKSVVTQENCVPSSNTRSANMQSQHKMEY